MQVIPIQALPNQAFTIVLDDNRWDFVIKTTNGAVSVSLDINNVPLIKNLRAVANTKIIPSQYEENGNFSIVTLNQELPEYTKFGISQRLIYASQTEIDALRQPSSSPYITADDFDPIAPLPLRFKPQGYVLAP